MILELFSIVTRYQLYGIELGTNTASRLTLILESNANQRCSPLAINEDARVCNASSHRPMEIVSYRKLTSRWSCLSPSGSKLQTDSSTRLSEGKTNYECCQYAGDFFPIIIPRSCETSEGYTTRGGEDNNIIGL